MKGKENVNLDKYSGKEFLPVQQPVPELVQDYKAIEETKGKRLAYFVIVDADGENYGFNYAHLTRWNFSPPSLMSLMISGDIITLEGQNLGQIQRLLIEGKIRTLRVFNGRDKKPDRGQPIIEKLTIEGLI